MKAANLKHRYAGLKNSETSFASRRFCDPLIGPICQHDEYYGMK